ncbi:MAG TPA: glutamyl-tRNA reductase, partial [Planctomycetota bacterium]|nr:glutamyl-tRNA reductase [Planctomycetota bacterium]
ASVRRFFEEQRGAGGFEELLYQHEGLDAIRHLFRVAAGIDSMVVGENEILGQVKRAYLAAVESGATGRALNRIFQVALHVGKTVRSSTSISAGQVSVPSVAVGLAEKIFQDFAPRTAVILGAGETGELTAAAFRSRGLRSFVVLNRTVENARRLANHLGGEPAGLDELPRRLAHADILISCASGDSPLVTLDHVRAAASGRRGLPLLLVDIAVPRSIDPQVDRLQSVYLYNIDDLESIASDNAVRRAAEVERSEEIIRREADKLFASASLLDPDDVIAKLRKHCDEIADEELRWALKQLDGVGQGQREVVEQLVRRLVTKILHQPLRGLKEGSEGHLAAEYLRRLFDLH